MNLEMHYFLAAFELTELNSVWVAMHSQKECR